jgi:hypothetical protein
LTKKEQRLAPNIIWGIGTGLFVGAGFALLAVIAYVARDAQEPGDPRTFVHALVGYALMGVLGGAIFGGTKPIQGTFVGRLIATYLVLVPVSAISLQIIDPELSLRDLAAQTLLISALIAPLALACFALYDRLSPRTTADDTRA